MKMIAHRGFSLVERENTYPALVAAGNRSFYGIEGDVRKTSDGKFILMHDETTTRVSLGKVRLKIGESNSAQIKNLLLPDLDGSVERQDIRVPFLSDYVKICKKYQKICVVELKEPFQTDDLVRLIREIKKEQYLEKTIFISFLLGNCIAVRSMIPDGEVEWLYAAPVTEETIKTLEKEKLDLDIQYRQLDQKTVDRLHEAGIKVNAWTCDDREEAEKLRKMGVDFLTTNVLEE